MEGQDKSASMNQEELFHHIYKRFAFWFNNRHGKPWQQKVDELNDLCWELAQEVRETPEEGDVDSVLDKIIADGIESLSPDEVALLDRYAKSGKA